MTFIIGVILSFLLIISVVSYIIVLLVKGEIDLEERVLNIFLLGSTITSWIIFFIGLQIFSEPYYKAIDPLDSDYSPFSTKHILTLIVFFLLSIRALYVLWKKGKNIPPLKLIIYVTAIIIGIFISCFVIFQLLERNEGENDINNLFRYVMIYTPINHIIISILLLYKIIKQESTYSFDRKFKNLFLNFLNQKLINSSFISVWTLIILLPFYLIITLILILFGQDYDSLVRVFTDTSTWHFSQKAHPPYLDHTGHYLCTVAACGDPKIVKPLRLGVRHGNTIIVNRQLMIANAFEDILHQKYPVFHKFIRENYDKYGYPLSKKINTKFWSNFTYIMMKPLEWIFLFTLYLMTNNPEKLIKKQYS